MASILLYCFAVTVSTVSVMPSLGLTKQARMCHLSIVICSLDNKPTFIAKACVLGALDAMRSPSFNALKAFNLLGVYVQTFTDSAPRPFFQAVITALASILLRSHLLLGESIEITLATIYAGKSNSFASDLQKACASLYHSKPICLFSSLALASQDLRFARICASVALATDSLFLLFFIFLLVCGFHLPGVGAPKPAQSIKKGGRKV